VVAEFASDPGLRTRLGIVVEYPNLLEGQWTLLDQSAIADLLPAASATGVSIIAAGVFNSGILADPGADPKFAKFRYHELDFEILERANPQSCGSVGKTAFLQEGRP
jgi:aryl-alcohol dehydrogenase-like predicted oxidoreductase